jgi:predicted dinucleotide-binding enzyme
MRIGVIGAGQLAQAFAIRVLASGHEVVLSNDRGPDTLGDLVHALGQGAHAGTRYQAAGEDTVVLAVPGERTVDALSGLPDWEGRTLVDATNHLSASTPLPGVMSTSELVAELAPGAKVVKALNTLLAPVLALDPEPAPGMHRVVFVCGDDLPSKDAFRAFLEQLRFATIDLGGLAEGSRLQQFPGGTLAGSNLLRVH